MALTVNLKPSGFQPVGGGDLIYQFTEASVVGKPNYRVELEFNGLFGGLKFEYRPNAALVVRCNIAEILASALKLSTLTTDRMKNTYVKYQAVWDGGSDAQVPLSGDVIYFYVGNNHALNYRTKLDIRSTDGNATPSLATGVFLLDPASVLPVRTRKLKVDLLCDGTLPANAEFSWVWDIYSFDYVFTGNVKGLYSFEFTVPNFHQDPLPLFIYVRNNAHNLYYAYARFDVLISESENPVYLQWINDYGGLQTWMFDYNQGYSISPDDSEKYPSKLLIEDGISFAQWKALNELKRKGVIYNDNYRIGQFIQDITDAANPINLLVDPTSSNTQTKKVGHQFQVSVRYNAIPNNRVTA